MQRLVFHTVLAAGLIQSLAGCIISSDDDDDVVVHGNHGSGDPGAGILWFPDWVCPPDAETITFFVTPVGETSAFEDTYDCDDPRPDALAYDAGDYDVEALPEGSIGPFVSQTDDTLGGNDGDLIEDISFVFTDTGGFFDIAWTIEGEDAATACADGDTVSVVGTLDGVATPYIDDNIPCTDGAAFVPLDPDGWPIGDWVLDIALVDADGNAISEPDPIVTTIDYADQQATLDTTDFLLKL